MLVETRNFKFFNINEDDIKKFTIDPKLNSVERRSTEVKLNTELVSGKCKSCSYSTTHEIDLVTHQTGYAI